MPIIILAHGALGAFDEIIFVSIAVIFVGMMGVSWLRSQNLPDDDFDTPPSDDVTTDMAPNTEHFELK